MKKCVDFSAIITAHNEGLLAHKTMRSVLAGLKKITEAKYTYEIIIHIDNGDKTTRDYFSRYKKDKDVKIFENSFGDTGSSRNFAVEKSSGKYIAFLDADDLMSDNWFVNAIKELEKAEVETVVYPEAVLTFGLDLKNNVLSIQKPSYGKEKDTILMLGENRWCSVVMGKRETFQKIPYKKLGLGYSHEDYVFNIEIIENNINQVIAKDTVLFYRRSEKSRLSSSNQNHATIPYMKLFDFDFVKQLDVVSIKDIDVRLKNKGYRFYKKIRNNNFLNYFITPVAKITIKVLNKNNSKEVPDFVIREWKRINKIEFQLYPHPWVVKGVLFYEAEKQVAVGNAYLELINNVKNRNPDYVFIVPWVVRGGADKVLFNYIEALHEVYGWRFTVIATLPANNRWNKRLPDYVDFIDFGNKTQILSPEQQENLFTRLIVQLKCKRLHIINSEYGYKWVKSHLGLLQNNYKLNISLFCGEYIPGSNLEGMFSYDDPYLVNIYDAVNSIFTDNKTVIGDTIKHNAFNEDKFKVHYQPVKDIVVVAPKEKLVKKGKLRILWASRIVPTKLPELVAEIGKKLDPKKFQIDVFGEKSDEVDNNIFSGSSVIKYKGAFDGFSSISTDDYDLLLYTSMNDGMPNVILEATAAGLPIIASDDGGVGELIQDKKTGVLIKNYLDSDKYVIEIERLLETPSVLKKYAKNAQSLLLKRHKWETFIEKVRKDID